MSGERALAQVGRMARQVRLEYPGAVYHCMARGDRREDIVVDERDRDAFARLLGELVERTGWEVFAWALLSNHYHLVFKTPEANLVDGMKWLQNTWTKRFNARHGLTGHVFGGRYKSVLVEDNEHLAVLIDYVHLNPVRAGLVKGSMSIADYRWSSLPDYLLAPRERSGWVRVEQGLRQRNYRGDSALERRRYLEHLEGIARDEGAVPGLPGQPEGRTLQSTLRRGWCFGTERFREEMLERLAAMRARETGQHRRESGYTGEQARDHGVAMATRLWEAGLAAAGLAETDLAGLAKNDWRKRVIGRAIRRRTTVSSAWIADKLAMGVSTRAAALVARDPDPGWGPDWNKASQLQQVLERRIENLD